MTIQLYVNTLTLDYQTDIVGHNPMEKHSLDIDGDDFASICANTITDSAATAGEDTSFSVLLSRIFPLATIGAFRVSSLLC